MFVRRLHKLPFSCTMEEAFTMGFGFSILSHYDGINRTIEEEPVGVCAQKIKFLIINKLFVFPPFQLLKMCFENYSV